MSFNQGIPGPATLINSSSTLLYGNSASANALSVQQLGAGNVATFRTTTGATALFVGANGNVGVGTTNPAYTLDVIGAGRFNTGTSNVFVGAGQGAGQGGFFMYPQSSIAGSSWNLGCGLQGSYSNAITFVSGTNIGIGTTNPGYLLDAGASVSIPLSGGETIRSKGPLIIGNGSNDNYRFISALDSSITATNTRFISFGKAASSYNSAEILYYHAGDASTSNYLGLGMYGINAPLYVAATGRVGIGITNPNAPLEVQNQTSATTVENLWLTAPNLTAGQQSRLFWGKNTGSYNGGFFYYYHVGDGSTSNYFHLDFNGKNNVLCAAATGNVGIGTTNPTSLLHVYSTSTNYTTIESGTASQCALEWKQGGTSKWINYVNSNSNDLRWYDGSDRMILKSGGYLGIGNVNPSYPLHVNGYVGLTSPMRYFNFGNPLTLKSAAILTNISIYASDDIAAGQSIVALSDRRAKVLEEPPTESYMDLVDKIQVHQFSWIDKIEKGSRKKIGFFAQEVEEVVPDAVGQTTGVVPTIYKQAEAFTESTVTVKNHGITTEKKLEVVDPENGKTKIDIVRVIDADNLEVKFEKVPKEKLFVVGPEVDDSRMVNHDYLMAVSFGGLKELHALVKTQQTTIEMLTERLSALEAKLNSQ